MTTTPPTVSSFGSIPTLDCEPFQRYLPTAFDNNLSYLQKINQLINYVNTISANYNTFASQWNDVTAWVEGAGLTNAVDNELTTWLNDGTMDTYINGTVFQGFSSEQTDHDNKIKSLRGFVGYSIEDYPLLTGETDDTGRLTRVIADAVRDGVAVLLPRTYTISATITIANNNVQLIGIRKLSKISLLSGSDFQPLTFSTPVIGFLMDGIIFDGNASTNSTGKSQSQLISLNNVTNFLVQNCVFQNSYADGFTIDGTSTDGVIQNCKTLNAGQDGFVLRDNVTKVKVINYTVDTTGVISGVGDGLIVKGSDITVVNCTSRNCASAGFAMNAEDNIAGVGFHNRFIDNKADSCQTGFGIGTVSSTLISAGELIGIVELRGNTIKNSSSSGYGMSLKNLNYVILDSNSFESCGSTALDIEDSNYVTLGQLTFKDCSTTCVNIARVTKVDGGIVNGRNVYTTTGSVSGAVVRIDSSYDIDLKANIMNTSAKAINITNSTDIQIDCKIDTVTGHNAINVSGSSRIRLNGLMKNVDQYGVLIQSGETDVDMVLKNVGVAGNNSYDGVYANGTFDKVRVKAKVTTDATNKHRYAVNFDSTVTNSTIMDSILQAGATGTVGGATGTGVTQSNIIPV